MKKTTQLFAGLLMLTGVLSACSPAGNEGFMRRVETDFRYKQELLPRGDLFGIFDEPMTPQERDAMTFLYAYMPVGDITDYLGDFYLENVRCALSVRQEMPWGRSVSDELFRHFVLPVRVNNECLDDSRRVFHDELKPRVEGLSMYDAILEVNHWCHEKANYQPSDARTSSPLATVRTAYGRCGEESTLLVAALRSVGIPARQVYTPRWAHTDDNHAWVEAWADGRWHFLGACEPEPVLDLGWFNAPASRGMLMHTKVFGYYDGSEEVMKTTANYTEINVISNYAACAPLTVTVTDTAGSPVEGATVEFKLYNYAEFYTVSRKTTDVRGRASLSAGLGDMLVTAVCDGRFGVRKVSFGRETEATVVLEHAIGGILLSHRHRSSDREREFAGGDGRSACGERPSLQPRRLHPQRLYRHVPGETRRCGVCTFCRHEAGRCGRIYRRFERQSRRNYGFSARREPERMHRAGAATARHAVGKGSARHAVGGARGSSL